MPNAFDIGDSVKLTFFVRVDGALTNATTALVVTKPDASTTSPAITNTATGTYTAVVVPDQAGEWLWKWTASGTATATDDGTFIVEANLTATLYCTVSELRDHLGDDSLTAPLDAGELEAATRAASRAIDRLCSRRFWLDPTVQAQTFCPDDPRLVRLPDIGSQTGVLVKTDEDDDGTFETTWAAADYQLEPLNASANGAAYAWTKLRAVSGKTFRTVSRGRPTLQVTARYGWSQIPDPVRKAAIYEAARLYKRKESPDGFASGYGDYGPVRVSRYADPDGQRLLRPFMRVLVA